MDSKEYLKSNTIKNRHFIVHQNNGISFNDNTTRSTLQKKRIEVIRSSANCTIIQMFRGCKIGNDIMLDHDFNDHCMKANTYYKNAKDHLNSQDLQDGIKKTVAHHDGQNKVCGKGEKWANPHAEIQILDANATTNFLEMGITSKMCSEGQYRNFPDGCQKTITNGYEQNKVIFAREPNHIYLFPHGGIGRIDADSIDMKYYCASCHQELQSDTGYCLECMTQHADHVNVKVLLIKTTGLYYISYIDIMDVDGNLIRIPPYISNLKFDQLEEIKVHIMRNIHIDADKINII